MNSVLIAERKSIDAAYMELMLKRSGWKVDIVNNEDSFSEKLENGNYNLVILDEDTLGGNIKGCIATVDREKTTILGTTGYSLRGQRRKLVQLGMDFCLSKPIYKNDLIDILANFNEEDIAVMTK